MCGIDGFAGAIAESTSLSLGIRHGMNNPPRDMVRRLKHDNQKWH